MLRRRIIYSMLALCLILTAGCGTVAQLNEKTVSADNVFSSPFPAFQMKVHPDLQYLGNFAELITSSETHHQTIQREAHFFGQMEDSVYTKGIFIDFQSLPNTLEWKGVPKLPDDYAVKSGTIQINQSSVNYIILPGNPLREKEQAFLTENGYTTSPCYLVQMFALQRAWARTYFFYFEQLPSCKERWNPQALSSEQQNFLETFTQNCINEMVFQ